MDCDSPYHRRCPVPITPAPQPVLAPGSPSWRVLDCLRLLNNQARRDPSTDAAAVRIAVRRLRGNQLT